MAASREPVAALTALRVHIRRKVFQTPGSSPFTAIDGVSFDLADGDFACVIGPSGSGKTTALNIIAGLDTDFEGDASLPGPHGRERLTYMFQTPRLLPWRTLHENVRLAIKGRSDDEAVAASWLDRVGLAGSHKLYPHQASLGMQRRAALARAFAAAPSILLMDEPFVSLDETSGAELRTLLRQLWRSERVTILFVTHDLREAASLATRALVFSKSPARLVADIRNVPDGEHEPAFRHKLENAVAASGFGVQP